VAADAVFEPEPQDEPEEPGAAAAPAPAVPPPAWRRGLSRGAAGAAALIAVVLVAATGIATAWRGGTTFPSPPARQIFNAPFTSGLKDARVRIHTQDGLTSQGVALFTPARGMHVKVTADNYTIQETIDLQGISYQRQGGDGRWKVVEGPSTSFHSTGWDDRDPPGNLRLSGVDQVGTEPAWHLTADDGYDWWIGVRDGYPLKMVRQVDTDTTTYVFDRFNAGARVQPPRDDAVSTQLARGKAGDLLRLSSVQAQLTHIDARYRAQAAPQPGHHYVAAYLTLTNTGTDPVDYDGLLNATDQTGFTYSNDSYLAPDPQVSADTIDPGSSLQGWLAFEVPNGTRGLTLRIPPPAEQTGADYLFSIGLGG
jgi:hypothetical protein